jgi:hypothetical protein
MGVVSKRVGHSQVSLTMDLYSHLLPETDRLAAEATETMIPRNPRDGFVTASAPEVPSGEVLSDETAGQTRWARWGLNPRPTDYESAALTD